MKTNFTKEFYEEHFDRFIKDSKMNLEEKLTFNLKFLEGIELPEDAIEKIRNSYAKEIAEKAEKELKERMKVIKGLENGSISFGYTTENQEIRERSNYIRIFEFDCFQLSKFKKDHNIIG
jgi:1-aminocyclopropane-1-carboxylate deaminase/D-cysteine desulfhydrase-like pyridoxal-dependent ACC family enzyme